tara:strand:- start:215 stop:1003 length:789 start_codon:yes stop_codon:yes gene_type:complete
VIKEQIKSNNEKFSIHVGIKCNGKKRLRVRVKDQGKVNTNYVDRQMNVTDSRNIYFNFPVTPKVMDLVVSNLDDPNDTDIQITTIRTPLKDFNIWLDQDTQDFLSLAIPFAQVCGFETATGNGRLFTTNDKKYQIKFFDIIRDYKSGKPLNTPARIGHSTGRIEIAKVKFDKYTVPMRMAILLHEYSHVFRNPKIGLEIQNEVGADINALYIYLGLGFSKIDAICVYANVFLKAQTKGNIERMRKIMDYIAKFENGDFAYRN